MISLSILVPAYNEQDTIERVLTKLSNLKIPGVKNEILVIDDGSNDQTSERIKKYIKSAKNKNIKLFQHQKNQGKGAAIITGVKAAKGDYIVIQDADLEYDPVYLDSLLLPIKKGESKVVYGTRLNRLPNLREDEKTFRFILHYLGNRFLSLIISALHRTWLTDIETGYKIFPRVAFSALNIKSKRFEFEPEITIKLLKHGYKIKELPIKTVPRGYGEGKKLNTIRDGSMAFWAIIKYSLKS